MNVITSSLLTIFKGLSLLNLFEKDDSFFHMRLMFVDGTTLIKKVFSDSKQGFSNNVWSY